MRRALASGASLDDVVPDPASLAEIDSGRRLRGTLRRARGGGRAGAGRGRPAGAVRRRGRLPARVPQRGVPQPVGRPEERRRRLGRTPGRGPRRAGAARRPDGAACGSCRRATSRSGACADKLLLATTPEAGKESLRRAIQGTAPGDQTTQWPQAHFLSPLHPVLDWAVDRALTRLGRNEVPVITAARRHARRAGAGDADQRPRPGGAAGARRHAVPRTGPAADRRPGRAGAAGGDRAARRPAQPEPTPGPGAGTGRSFLLRCGRCSPTWTR